MTWIIVAAALAAGAGEAPSWKRPKPFPGTVVGDILKFPINGASGIVYDAKRKTFLVNGDWSEVFEMAPDGSRVRHVRTGGFQDLEGITINPDTGMVYLVTERTDSILELDPKTLKPTREFPVERTFKGKTVLDRSGDGLEGITFRPDPKHPEGGTFFICNQGTGGRETDPPAVFEVAVPIKTGGKEGGKATILRMFKPGPPDLAGLFYDAARGRLYVISGQARLLLEMTPAGDLVAAYRMPPEVTSAQEGITFDAGDGLYIAVDGGGVIALKWARPAPTSRPTTQPAEAAKGDR